MGSDAGAGGRGWPTVGEPGCPADVERRLLEAIELSRESRGISVTALSRLAGVDCKRLRRVLKGERIMMADELVRLCVVLDVRPGLVLGRR